MIPSGPCDFPPLLVHSAHCLSQVTSSKFITVVSIVVVGLFGLLTASPTRTLRYSPPSLPSLPFSLSSLFLLLLRSSLVLTQTLSPSFRHTTSATHTTQVLCTGYRGETPHKPPPQKIAYLFSSHYHHRASIFSMFLFFFSLILTPFAHNASFPTNLTVATFFALGFHTPLASY